VINFLENVASGLNNVWGGGLGHDDTTFPYQIKVDKEEKS
jgi:hypothetical protein